MILITKTFEKLLNKIKSVSIEDISIQIKKHSKGLDNFVELGKIQNRKILKGYLLNKKVRLLILFQEKNGNYLPFYVVRKETKQGYNITKESIESLKVKLDNIFIDLENNDFEIFEIK